MLVDLLVSASQINSTSGQVEQPKLSLDAKGLPVSDVGLPPAAWCSIDSIYLINQSQDI